jgi:hypothetical protein
VLGDGADDRYPRGDDALGETIQRSASLGASAQEGITVRGVNGRPEGCDPEGANEPRER